VPTPGSGATPRLPGEELRRRCKSDRAQRSLSLMRIRQLRAQGLTVGAGDGRLVLLCPGEHATTTRPRSVPPWGRPPRPRTALTCSTRGSGRPPRWPGGRQRLQAPLSPFGASASPTSPPLSPWCRTLWPSPSPASRLAAAGSPALSPPPESAQGLRWSSPGPQEATVGHALEGCAKGGERLLGRQHFSNSSSLSLSKQTSQCTSSLRFIVGDGLRTER
jgi:hypothetical protein